MVLLRLLVACMLLLGIGSDLVEDSVKVTLELMKAIRSNAAVEIATHKAIISQLEEFHELSLREEQKIRDSGSNLMMSTNIFGSLQLYESLKDSSFKLTGQYKKLVEPRHKLKTLEKSLLYSTDNLLTLSREISADISNSLLIEQPPTLSEMFSTSIKEHESKLRNNASASEIHHDENEIFLKGYKLYNESRLDKAYEMLAESWRVYNVTEKLGRPHAVSEVDILEWFQHVAYQTGRVDEAIAICEYALRFDKLAESLRKKLQKNIRHYKEEAIKIKLRALGEKIEKIPLADRLTLAEELGTSEEYNFCRDELAGEVNKKLASNPKNFCRLDNRGRNPLLILSPVKEEFLSMDPPIVIFHDIILQTETDRLKELSESKFKNAGLVDEKLSDGLVQLEVRKAQTAWLKTMLMPKLSARIEVYTGLNPYGGGAENYQVGHYTIGGHYRPHYDYIPDTTEVVKQEGNRIATLLIYLNDVEKGGGTVFTKLKLRVTAKARAAVFWYNLLQNETGDVRTLHAACPVLRGEKWVTNTWFHIREQFLHLPCGLRPDDSYSLNNFVIPEWLCKRRSKLAEQSNETIF